MAVYLELDIGRDQLAIDNDLRITLVDGFFKRTGRHVTGDLLYAFAMSMQKHRANGWPRMRKGKLGWGDIGEVA